MKYRRLGRTNMQVPALGLGAICLPGFENNINTKSFRCYEQFILLML